MCGRFGQQVRLNSEQLRYGPKTCASIRWQAEATIATFRPSTNPASVRPSRNAVTRCAEPAAAVLLRKPTTGTAGCCARAENGHPTAAPPSSVMNSRRPIIRSPRRQVRAASLRADVRLLDDSPPLIHLGAQKGVKLIRRRADHHDGVPFELVSDRRLCEGC